MKAGHEASSETINITREVNKLRTQVLLDLCNSCVPKESH
jgi:hypothetical protein